MNYSKFQTAARLLVAGACIITAGVTQGAEYWLRAGSVTNTMPDGRAVVMWGFANDTAGPNTGAVMVPGPQLTAAAGDSLVIHVQNTLPEPVSIVIPGQYGFLTQTPVFHTDGAYAGRARSLTQEAAPGGSATYTWTAVQAGTFGYHSGTHPSVQVQMGLYGAVVVVAPGPAVYATAPGMPASAFNSQVTLLFSEIDPEVHDAVAASSFGPGPAFLQSDFADPAGFIAQVSGSGDLVAQFVAANLSGDPTTLASDLNALIGGPSIYDPALFPDTVLSAGTLAILTSDPPPSQNYPIVASGVAFNGDLVRMNRMMLYDGLTNAGVLTMPSVKTMTSTIRSYAQYFLVNGAPYTNGTPAIVAGTAGSTIAVRMLNFGMDHRVPTLNGGDDLLLLGEDGQQTPYTRSSAVVWMPALKTVDALWTPASAGTYVIYDRRLGLASSTIPSSGQIAPLSVGASGSPTAPTILVPPANQSVFVGQTATFTVVATHTGTLSYQWQRNGVNVGANSSSYTTPAAVAGDDGALFTVVLTDSAAPGSPVTAGPATLHVFTGPTITGQPASQIVFAGTPVSFTVTATTSGSATYQLQKLTLPATWNNVGGPSGSSTITLPSVVLANGGSYRIVVTDTLGSSSLTATSATAVLTVITQPAPLTVNDHATATFSITTSSPASLTYQWQDNGNPITGANSATLSFAADWVTQNGHVYSVVVVATPGGTLTSAGAMLTIIPIPPSITTQPAGVTVADFSPAANFSVVANGTAITYQWQRRPNGGATYTNIPGATATSYTVVNVVRSRDNNNQFRVVITGPAATLNSGNATLSVTGVAPQIVTQPHNVTVNAGTATNISVMARASGFMTFQWQKLSSGTTYTNVPFGGGVTFSVANNGLEVNTATINLSATATANLARAGTYRVIVTSAGVGGGQGAGSATSIDAVLVIVTSAPVFGTQPASVSVNSGTGVSFTAAATGVPTPTYQWQRFNGTTWVNLVNGGGIGGANTGTLTLSGTFVNVANAGQYRMLATNGAGSVPSNVANLTVRQTFTGGTAMTIPNSGTATAYPRNSSVVPAFIGGSTVKAATVSLTLTHPRPYDLGALLVSPSGTKVELLAGIGPATGAISGVALTLDDAAAGTVPTVGTVASGTYKPTVTRTVSFPAPAPAPAYATALSSFNGNTSAGGVGWSLYVDDDTAGPGTTTGSVNSWSVTLTVGP